MNWLETRKLKVDFAQVLGPKFFSKASSVTSCDHVLISIIIKSQVLEASNRADILRADLVEKYSW